MEKRAYSLLKIKSIDEDKREITGIASTPEPDRVGDIVNPDGAVYKLPIPLLWQHDSNQPIGEVYEAKNTPEGILVKARLVKVAEPSQLSARLDEAWQSIKTGLVKGLSIGFRAIEYAFIDDGGIRFDKWDWYELSAVTIPANAEASITSVKSFDAKILKAATGKKEEEAENKKLSGVTEKKTVKLTPKEGKMKISEQVKSYQNERAAKVAKMEEIMEKSAESGESLADDQAEEYDTLEQEVASIDKHLNRLEGLQKAQMEKAKPVDVKPTEEAAVTSRQTYAPIKIKQQIDKGIGFARLAKVKALSRLNHASAYEVAKSLYGDDNQVTQIMKANVSAGTTTDATWASPLVGDETSIFADFIEYLRPMTILGKFGQGNVPGLRRVPFRTPLIGQTSGGEGYWVGEGAPKPLTSFDFSRTTLDPLKVANIAVVTMELLRDSSPSAEAIIRDQLAAALKARMDVDFIDPTKTASAGVSPASITNGVTPVTSSGNTADDIRNDIKALFAGFIAANNAPTSGVFIMSATTALALSLMTNALGQSEFPSITMQGGSLNGLPVIVSEYVPTDTAGGYVFLVNAGDVYFGDDGEVSVDMSDQASLQMMDNPTNNSATPTATSMVSMFQTNSVAFRAERTINWAKRRASAVAVLDGVNWGAATAE